MFDWKDFLKQLESKTFGIVNVTEDSFSGDGILHSKKRLKERFNFALENNINFLDVGCMSTKPDFKMINTNEELDRLNFFLDKISDKFYYSIDTLNSLVAERALDSGFLIINDVSGFSESKMIELAIQRECGIIVMHRNPASKNIQEKMDDSKELFLNLNNLIKTYPVIVGYSRKKFTNQIKMTSSEMKDHCFHSGVDLLQFRL